MKHRLRNRILIAISTAGCIGCLILSISVNASPSHAAVNVDINDQIDYQALNNFISLQNDGQAKFFQEDEGVVYASKKFIVLKKPIKIIYQPKLLTDLGWNLSFDSRQSSMVMTKIPDYYLLDISKLTFLLSLPESFTIKNNSSLIQANHPNFTPNSNSNSNSPNSDNLTILLLSWTAYISFVLAGILLVNRAKKKPVNRDLDFLKTNKIIEAEELSFQEIYTKNKKTTAQKKKTSKKEKDFV